MLETDSSQNPQSCFFLDIICCFKLQEIIAYALHRVKSQRKKRPKLAESETFCGIHIQICSHYVINYNFCENRLILRHPLTICRIRFNFGNCLHALNPEPLPIIFRCKIHVKLKNWLSLNYAYFSAESRTTIYNCPFQYLRQTSVPTKFTLRIFVREIQENFVSGNHLPFGIYLETFCRT